MYRKEVSKDTERTFNDVFVLKNIISCLVTLSLCTKLFTFQPHYSIPHNEKSRLCVRVCFFFFCLCRIFAV